MLSEDSELVDLIYAATLGERPWEDFMRCLARTTPGGVSLMFSFDHRRGDQVVTMLEGRPSNEKGRLDSYYGTINPYAPHCLAKPLGVGVIGDAMVPRERLERTEFYNDYMLDIGTRATFGMTVDRSPECTILISTATVRNDHEEQRRLAAQYTRLAPHLQRAAAFYRRTAPGRMASELGGSLFDAVDVGVILVTHDRRLVSISTAAERIARSHLSFDASGRVRLPGDAAQAALKAMCSRRYVGPQSQEFVTPGLKLTLVKISRGGVIGMFDDCGVAVLVRPTGGISTVMDLDMIGQAYGLTRAELRALQGVVEGKTTDDIARSVGRSRETIRSQLKSLYAKTGTAGRIDLMCLLGGPMP